MNARQQVTSATAPEQLLTQHLHTWTHALKPKASAGRGSNGKTELYGIKKLRELILELAVRGLLVPQNPNDEPASALLEKIAAEKARLVKEGKIKKQKALPPIGEDEKPFDSPSGWQWIKLGELNQVVRGVSYKKHDASEVQFSESITLMRANNINVVLNQDKLVFVPRHIVKEDQLIRAGDILIAMSSGSADLVGKAAQALESVDATFGAFCAVLRPLSKDLFQFMGFFTKTPLYREQTQSTGKGIGIQNLNKAGLENLLIPLPPLAEQHRIVAKVDELMALCDQLEQQTEVSLAAHQTLVETLLNALTRAADAQAFTAAWQRIAEHFDTLFTTEQSIDQLKQCILQLAVMGKLVPQDPFDEPASELLKKIAAEKAQLVKDKKIKKQKPLPPIAEDEKPFELPEGWEWVRLGLLFKSFTNGLYKPEKFYSDAGTISLRMYNIQEGEIDFTGARRVEIEPNEFEQYKLEAGDLLINRVNSKELVGKTAIIPSFDEPLVFESMNMRAKPFHDYLASSYLNLFMKSPFARAALFSHAKEAVGQASINQGQVSSLIAPLPPLEEQHRIVAKVDELMALCDQLKARLTQAQTTQLQLADAITEQAV